MVQRVCRSFLLNGAHGPCCLVLHASAVLIAELYPAKGSKTNGADEADEPNASDQQTSGEKGERGAGEHEWRGTLHGWSSGGDCFGEDAVDEGCFLRGECRFEFLAGRGALGGKLDVGDEKRL
jgi:hypothetical protein